MMLMQTLVHELMHAQFPDIAEDAVVEYDVILGRALKRMDDIHWRWDDPI